VTRLLESFQLSTFLGMAVIDQLAEFMSIRAAEIFLSQSCETAVQLSEDETGGNSDKIRGSPYAT
jgi:hypothetical protein